MTIEDDLKESQELFRSAEEAHWVNHHTRGRLERAIFLTLRATSETLGLTPENNSDVKKAYESFEEIERAESAPPNAEYKMIRACYYLTTAVQEKIK